MDRRSFFGRLAALAGALGLGGLMGGARAASVPSPAALPRDPADEWRRGYVVQVSREPDGRWGPMEVMAPAAWDGPPFGPGV